MIIEIKTPNNIAKEELEILQQILNIDGEKYPFKIIHIDAHFAYWANEPNE